MGVENEGGDKSNVTILFCTSMFTVIVIYVNAHKRTTLRCQSELRADQPPASTTSFLSNLHSDLYIDKKHIAVYAVHCFFPRIVDHFTYTSTYTVVASKRGTLSMIIKLRNLEATIDSRNEKKKKKQRKGEKGEENSLERMLFRFTKRERHTEIYA